MGVRAAGAGPARVRARPTRPRKGKMFTFFLFFLFFLFEEDLLRNVAAALRNAAAALRNAAGAPALQQHCATLLE